MSTTKRSTTTQSERPGISEVARELVIPSGIVTTGWPAIRAKAAELRIAKYDPWQDGLGRIALGKRADGKYAATVGGIVLSIGRQVGKTFLVGSILVTMCILFPRFRVLWTAHRQRTATNTFRSLQGICARKNVAPHIAYIRTANGEQEIGFRNGSVMMFGAREQGFGRGFDEVDAEVFDEAQILTEKALEDMIPATNQARHPHGALIFYMGTPPRPVDPGEAFSLRRDEALSGQSDDMVYAELSADVDADPDDRDQWAKANPSYPVRTPLESMLRMRKNLPSNEAWLREALGIWDPKLTDSVIDSDSWTAVADPASMATDRLTLAIDVAPDRRFAAVSLGGLRPDGLWHVELDEHRKGTGWVVGWVKNRAAKNELHAVVVDELSGLVERRRKRSYLKGTDIEVTLAASEGRDMAMACAGFYDAVMADELRHTDQPQVNSALAQAGKRKVGAGWAWSKQHSEADITPTVSQTLALWGAQNDNVKRPTTTQREKATSGGWVL